MLVVRVIALEIGPRGSFEGPSPGWSEATACVCGERP